MLIEGKSPSAEQKEDAEITTFSDLKIAEKSRNGRPLQSVKC